MVVANAAIISIAAKGRVLGTRGNTQGQIQSRPKKSNEWIWGKFCSLPYSLVQTTHIVDLCGSTTALFNAERKEMAGRDGDTGWSP